MANFSEPEKPLTVDEQIDRDIEQCQHEYEFDTPGKMIMQEVLAIPLTLVWFIAAGVTAPFKLTSRLIQHKKAK